MKKSIFLLFLLLIACAPVATVPPPTVTSLPPSPTITPSPTEAPSPTPTPEGFQTSPDGIVQVFENGKWVDMSAKIPDTIWGGKPEGASVVLKDGEAFLQMELNNFQTEDGSTNVDIAKYNEETKTFEVQPFSVTRTEPLNSAELYERNNAIHKESDSGIDLLSSQLTVLGLRVLDEDNNNYELMVLYKVV